jgi:hypothetical protein
MACGWTVLLMSLVTLIGKQIPWGCAVVSWRRDLVVEMNLDLVKRITARDALAHYWFCHKNFQNNEEQARSDNFIAHKPQCE